MPEDRGSNIQIVRYLIALAVGAMLTAVIVFLLWPDLGETFRNDTLPETGPSSVANSGPPPTITVEQAEVERRLQTAVQYAIATCQLQVSNVQKKNIEVKSTYSLSKAGADGSSSSETLRSAYDVSLSENGRLTVDERVRSCMVKQTGAALQVNASKPVTAPTVAVDSVSKQRVMGYIYYEEAEGRLTDDGVFNPIGSDMLPNYSTLQRGTILRANSTARVRADPVTKSDFVGNILAGECVKITDRPRDPLLGLENATSGGRVRIEAVACPTSL